MKKIAAISVCLFTGLGLGLTACADDGGYACTLTWQTFDDQEVETSISYSGLEDAQEAVDMCEAEEPDHEDRPDNVESWDCDCEST